MVIVPDVVEVSPVAVKLKVRSPAVPVIDRLAKVATPLLFVAAVRVPPSVPPPVPLTALPLASRNGPTGCWRKPTPLCAVADGGVLIVTWVAVPGVADALKGTGDPAPVACTVWVPAAVPSVQVVTAMPLVLLV